MKRNKNTGRMLRSVRLLLLASGAWLVCGVALPSDQQMGTHGLISKLSNLVIDQAYADNSSSSDKSGNSENSDKSSSDKSSNSENSDKSGNDKSSSSESSSSSSTTLVCESRSTVETTLGLTSSNSENSDKSGSDKSSNSENSDKSGSDKSSNSENSDNSGGDKSSNSENSDKSGNSENSDNNKVTMCHYPGNSGRAITITIDQSAESAHLAIGDTVGACTVTQSYIESLPTCAALTSSGTVTGVWVPESAVGSQTALNDFYTQAQAGSAAVTPFDQGNDATRKSYREIRGQ